MKLKEKILIPRSKTYSELFQEVAKRLNENGSLPYRGREYNIGIVQSHAYGKIKDEQVETMLKSIANEWYAN
mgnify:CR=1 FL=1|jgi:hypothetical protein